MYLRPIIYIYTCLYIGIGTTLFKKPLVLDKPLVLSMLIFGKRNPLVMVFWVTLGHVARPSKNYIIVSYAHLVDSNCNKEERTMWVKTLQYHSALM